MVAWPRFHFPTLINVCSFGPFSSQDYITEDEIRRDFAPGTADYIIQTMQPYPGVEGGFDYKSYADSLFSA